jgi:hypothetical protein
MLCKMRARVVRLVVLVGFLLTREDATPVKTSRTIPCQGPIFRNTTHTNG